MADALLTVENLTKSFGDKLLFEDISFGINAGQKSALIARNGYGKSTLLNILMTAAGQQGYNTLQDSGKITFRGDLKLAYLPQSDPSMTSNASSIRVRDFVYNIQRPETEDSWTFEQRMEEILSRMKVDTLLDRQMETLSGGEQKKVALCRLLMDDCNLLILDEPTNHLDMNSKDILKNALLQYTGTLIVVSHDRDFLSGLTDELYEFRDGAVHEFKGDIMEFLNSDELRVRSEESKGVSDNSSLNTPHSTLTEGRAAYEQSKERERERRKLQNAVKQKEQEIEALEAEIAAKDAILATGEAQSPDFYKEYQQLKTHLDQKMAEWEDAVIAAEQ